MKRIYRWSTVEGNGIEHLALAVSATRIEADSVVIGPEAGGLFEGELLGCTYRLRCDPDWRVREVAVRLTGGATMVLQADGAGSWTDGAGRPLSELDGCIDVDLACTPFTNTLPIRRLDEAVGQRHAIRVAFVAFPDLKVRASSQVYTRLAPGRYLFDSPEHGFSAEIGTDDDGLVLDYPGLFVRRAA